MRVGHYDLSCFLCFEVSHASYTQDENITPRYFSEMSRTEFPQSDCKITQSIMSFKHFVQIQTSEVVVYSLDDHMPVYYRTFPGNIPDSRSVETLLTDLRHAGFPNVALLTDRGYESIQNLERYILNGQKMVMCVKVGQSFVLKHILEYGDFAGAPECR